MFYKCEQTYSIRFDSILFEESGENKLLFKFHLEADIKVGVKLPFKLSWWY